MTYQASCAAVMARKDPPGRCPQQHSERRAGCAPGGGGVHLCQSQEMNGSFRELWVSRCGHRDDGERGCERRGRGGGNEAGPSSGRGAGMCGVNLD